MAKRLTSKEQASNAVKWINTLTRYKKTTHQLGQDRDGKWRYCCLGVACDLHGLTPEWTNGNEPLLVNVIGLRDPDGDLNGTIKDKCSLVELNDEVFAKDGGFKRMQRAIVENFNIVFRPAVAKHIVRKGDAIAIRKDRPKGGVPAPRRTGAKRSLK